MVVVGDVVAEVGEVREVVEVGAALPQVTVGEERTEASKGARGRADLGRRRWVYFVVSCEFRCHIFPTPPLASGCCVVDILTNFLKDSEFGSSRH